MIRFLVLLLFLVLVNGLGAETALARSINQITVRIKTSNVDGAGTDGNVYLGICGREFFLDSVADDFEAGSIRTYTLGEDTTIKNSDRNDPRSPRLDTEDLIKFPIYIRFETPPSDPTSDWGVSFISVEVEGRNFGASFVKGLWLGLKSGLVCFLREGKFSE